MPDYISGETIDSEGRIKVIVGMTIIGGGNLFGMEIWLRLWLLQLLLLGDDGDNNFDGCVKGGFDDRDDFSDSNDGGNYYIYNYDGGSNL